MKGQICHCWSHASGSNDAKRNYFSSNLHDVSGEVIKAEWRLEKTESHQRTKRKYNKKNESYWTEGIREQRKKPRNDL